MQPVSIRIATRKSPLALWQANFVKQKIEHLFPSCRCELVPIVTQGDKLLHTSLIKVGGKGLFVKELEQALLDNRADIAVHSMKDVPISFPENLGVHAILARACPRDAFVSNEYNRIAELPPKARIGTSSLRRQTQLKALRPDLKILNLRGNVNTRLKKLDEGNFDAIILAASGLERLGYKHRINHALPPSQMLPAAGQGALGIECRNDDQKHMSIIQALSCRMSECAVLAERQVNILLGASCQVPIASYAVIEDKELTLRALVGSAQGDIIIHHSKKGPVDNYLEIGHEVAQALLGQGADKLLQSLTDE